MKLALSIIVVVFTLIALYFFVLGYLSKKDNPIGLMDGRLAPCGQKPNCVCSEYPDDQSHFVLPIDLSLELSNSSDAVVPVLKHTPDDIMRTAKQAILALGGQLQTVDDKREEYSSYLAATFQSALFGFVDDVELRFDSNANLLHLRSASRVGHSDFGANLKRIKKLKHAISARLVDVPLK